MAKGKDDNRGNKPRMHKRLDPGYVVRPGNLPHVVTDEKTEMVFKLAGLHLSQKDIADVMGVSEDTIQRHYADAFSRGRTIMGMRLRENAHLMALGVPKDPTNIEEGYLEGWEPDPEMTKFLLRTQHGFKLATEGDLTGNINITFNQPGDDAL